jgi:hypothetical protein
MLATETNEPPDPGQVRFYVVKLAEPLLRMDLPVSGRRIDACSTLDEALDSWAGAVNDAQVDHETAHYTITDLKGIPLDACAEIRAQMARRERGMQP